MLSLAFVLSPTVNVQAAELQVLAGGAMTAPMRELGAQFENATGHKLVMRFGTTPELIKLAGSPVSSVKAVLFVGLETTTVG